MISVLIPTKNEERDLPGCLRSVSWSDDVHVYDSGSSDATASIARAHGAHFTTSPVVGGGGIFGGDEAAHKNWALDHLPFKYPWVLHVDADERITPELRTSMSSAIANPGDAVAFRVRRRDFFDGRWLKHVQATAFYVRLFQPRYMRYERFINPVSRVSGPVSEVPGFLDHFPFSKGVSHWVQKHNAYSSLEAKQIIENRANNANGSTIQAVFARDPSTRRASQKELFYRVPGRPLVKFAVLYFLHGGFLDGRPGLVYAALQSFYELLIVLKTREMSRLPQDAAASTISGSWLVGEHANARAEKNQ